MQQSEEQLDIVDDNKLDQQVDDEKIVSFRELGVCEELCEACEKLNFVIPTKIQKESLPYSLQGKDIIGLAETGSGKTLSFALPVLQALLNNPQPFFAVVLAPTRELCIQISEQFQAVGSGINVKTVVLVGGLDPMAQAIALSKNPHIVIGSPGRLLYHLENTKGFSLKNLKFLIMDEADKLLNMDFEREITKILEIIPKKRTTLLFSATMTSKVQKLQRASLSDPVKIEVSQKYQTVSTLRQNYIFLPSKYKDCYLVYILNEYSGNSVIVFVSTVMNAMRSCLLLRNLGFSAVTIHGQLSQVKRMGSLNKFKSQECNIIIATDVASRGLDIPSVDLVINYDIPQHSKDYVHRVGRTARAGKAGKAITFVTQYDVEAYQKIEQLLQQKLDTYKIDEEEVLIFHERVAEASRIANQELKGLVEKKQNKEIQNDDDDDNDESNKLNGKKGFKKNNNHSTNTRNNNNLVGKKQAQKNFKNPKNARKKIKFDI